MKGVMVAVTWLVGAVMWMAVAAPARAQVGHEPERSPFRELNYKQELSVFGGYFGGSEGDAGVAPGSGPLVGVRYAIRIGGPVHFTARLARAFTERTIIDPARRPDARVVGTESWPVYLADVGLGLNLTGQKSYHHLVPEVNAGIGVASDAGQDPDVGGYSFGTPFAISFGGGIRWVPRGQWQLRVDVADYLYKLSYPNSYFAAPPGVGTPVFPPTAAASEWTHNPVFSLGVAYYFSR